MAADIACPTKIVLAVIVYDGVQRAASPCPPLKIRVSAERARLEAVLTLRDAICLVRD